MKPVLVFDGEEEIYLDAEEVTEMTDIEEVVKLFKATAVYRSALQHMLQTITATELEEFVAEKVNLSDAGYNALIEKLFSLFGEDEVLMLLAQTDIDIKLAGE